MGDPPEDCYTLIDTRKFVSIGAAMKAKKQPNLLSFRPEFGIGDLQKLVAEHDGSLAQYYVGHDRFFQRAHNRDDLVSVFIGPKGVGKSAVLQMVRLAEAAAGNSRRVIEVAPDDMAFNALLNIETRTPLLKEAGHHQWLFKSLWDYVLSVAILEKETGDRGRLEQFITQLMGGRTSREQAKLLKVTLTDDGTQKRSMTDQMLALVEQIQLEGSYGGAEVAAKVGLRETAPAPGDLKLLQLISNVAKQLPQAIQHDYYILIDDLDLHWRGTPLQNAFLGTLMYSMRKLGASPKLKFVVSLRKNIYRQIDLEERDKFSDHICEMEWSDADLREMIEKRVEHVLNVPHWQIWSELFPEGAFDYIRTHTNGMPREIIRLAVLCVSIAQEAKHLKIEQEDMARALQRFSEGRLDDLASAYQYEYPGLSVVLNQFSGGAKEFDCENLREISFRLAERAQKEQNPRYVWATGGVDNPLILARTLLNTGFLQLKDGRASAARQTEMDETELISESNWYAVHPMYAPGLELRGWG
jgi:hypothetical protein